MRTTLYLFKRHVSIPIGKNVSVAVLGKIGHCLNTFVVNDFIESKHNGQKSVYENALRYCNPSKLGDRNYVLKTDLF